MPTSAKSTGGSAGDGVAARVRGSVIGTIEDGVEGLMGRVCVRAWQLVRQDFPQRSAGDASLDAVAAANGPAASY